MPSTCHTPPPHTLSTSNGLLSPINSPSQCLFLSTVTEFTPFGARCTHLPKCCAHFQSPSCQQSFMAAGMILLTWKAGLSLPAYDPSGILPRLRLSPLSNSPASASTTPSQPCTLLRAKYQQFSAPFFTFTTCSTCLKCLAFCSSLGEALFFLLDPVPVS